MLLEKEELAKLSLKTVSNKKFSAKITILFLVLIGIVGFSIRIFYFPTGVPLTLDSLGYFFYAMDISTVGKLPENYTPINNGWPLFLSSIFSIFPSEKTQFYMDLQRITTVLISVLTLIPVYFLCKKFVSNKISIIGAGIIVFEPRLIQNSLFGIADSLYIFLVATTLLLFLDNNKKIIYISFAISAFATIIRSEGLFLFIAISIVYLIRFRKNKLDLIKYIPLLGIFLLILLPIQLYRMDIYETDGIFIRVINTAAEKIKSPEITGASTGSIAVENILVNFPKYFVWDLIPIFILFIPIGVFQIFKKIEYSKLTIIVSTIFMVMPAMHAYSIPLQETRFFYFIYPVLCVISVLSIEKFIDKVDRKKLLFVLILSGILLTSMVFLNFKMWDPDEEKESFMIAQFLVKDMKGVNNYYPQDRYIEAAQIPEQVDDLKKYFFQEREMKKPIRDTLPNNVKVISIDEFSTLDELLVNSEKIGLSHLVIDNEDGRPNFFKDIFQNEEKYPFLIKKYDSSTQGFNYHVKIFEINYDLITMDRKNQ